MPICKECGTKFPNRMLIDGKQYHLQRRRYCLECSPFGLKAKNRKTDEERIKGKDIVFDCPDCHRKHSNRHADKFCPSCKSKRRRKKIKKFAIDYKGGCCQKCGYNKCTKALAFHHTDPSKKLLTLSASWCFSKERIVEEIDKCWLLCHNCHTEYHAGLWTAKNLPRPLQTDPPSVQCGHEDHSGR